MLREPGSARGAARAEPLVTRLIAALDAAGVRYCQWKGSGKPERWMSGEGDIDLLVDRASEAGLARVFERLGFKLALTAPSHQVPGVVSWLGPDDALRRLIHIHVHFKLVLGRAETRHYHLPIERAVLESTVPGERFRLPAPAFELVLFVLQQTLRHDFFMTRGATRERLDEIRPELLRLREQTTPADVSDVVERHLPDLSPGDFARCVASLDPEVPHRARLAAAWMLASRLGAHARGGTLVHYTRRLLTKLRRSLGPNDDERGKSLVSGGAIIALLGADGAGKSTCAKSIVRWLGTGVRTCHAHLGLPEKTWSTLAAGFALKLAQRLDRMRGRKQPSSLAAHLELFRHVCTARDRYILFRRMRRFATGGGIAVCERYPIPVSYALAGPSRARGLALDAESKIARGLRQLEEQLYDRMTPPELSIVLRVEPEVAVRRKTDEPEEYVRARARRMWTTDWTSAHARVIDAGRELEDVLAELRAVVWESL